MSVEARTQIQRAPIALPTVHSDLVRRQMRLAWWLLLPSLLVVALVALVPLLQTIYQSLTNERLASARAVQFVGLKNYADLLTDDAFRHSIWVTILFGILSSTLFFYRQDMILAVALLGPLYIAAIGGKRGQHALLLIAAIHSLVLFEIMDLHAPRDGAAAVRSLVRAFWDGLKPPAPGADPP